MTPTVGQTAPLIGAVDEAEATRFTFPFNLTGQPALSFPIASGALPVGIQLVAAPWREDVLLEISSRLEDVFGALRAAC